MDLAQTLQNKTNVQQATRLAFGSQLPKGPDYIDSGACRCALRPTPENVQGARGNEVAWRCTGNQTEDLYEGSSGKWFYPQNKGTAKDQAQDENSARNPPDRTTTSLVVDGKNGKGSTFQATDASDDPQLSELDAQCDGLNNTLSTSYYYQEIARLRAGLPPQLCADPNAVPVLLQDESSWNETGCLPGFYCGSFESVGHVYLLRLFSGPLNNVQRLPQFCPPIETCQHARLAGGSCSWSMGILEPRVCSAGKYCPLPGLKEWNCTAGHYCPRGSFTPLKCSVGASCPEGSAQDQSYLPLGLLAILDLLLILWLVSANLVAKRKISPVRSRRRSGSGHFLTRAATIIDHRERERSYHSLGEEEIRLESRISSVKRANTGFLAVIDNEYAFGDDDSTMSHPDHGKSDKDLNAFITSLGKSVETGTFGLSFEFENLAFVSHVVEQTVIIANRVCSIPKNQRNPFYPRSLGPSKRGRFWA